MVPPRHPELSRQQAPEVVATWRVGLCWRHSQQCLPLHPTLSLLTWDPIELPSWNPRWGARWCDAMFRLPTIDCNRISCNFSNRYRSCDMKRIALCAKCHTWVRLFHKGRFDHEKHVFCVSFQKSHHPMLYRHSYLFKVIPKGVDLTMNSSNCVFFSKITAPCQWHSLLTSHDYCWHDVALELIQKMENHARFLCVK